MAIAALALHVFMGDAAITDVNIGDFLRSARVIFLVFTGLCLAGVFISLKSEKPAGVSASPK
jgi:hypothetical protein